MGTPRSEPDGSVSDPEPRLVPLQRRDAISRTWKLHVPSSRTSSSFQRPLASVVASKAGPRGGVAWILVSACARPWRSTVTTSIHEGPVATPSPASSTKADRSTAIARGGDNRGLH